MPARVRTSKTRKPILTQVHTRLFTADLVRLRRMAAEKGVGYQELTRKIIHGALEDAPATGAAEPVSVYKFTIVGSRPDAVDPRYEWTNMAAVAVATSEEGAREIIRKANSADGIDTRWLAVADVSILPAAAGTMVIMVVTP